LDFSQPAQIYALNFINPSSAKSRIRPVATQLRKQHRQLALIIDY